MHKVNTKQIPNRSTLDLGYEIGQNHAPKHISSNAHMFAKIM
jgi:hypothetical protein